MEDLKKLQELYQNQVNIIRYLKNKNKDDINTREEIMISYDLQAGSYIKETQSNPEWGNIWSNALSDVLNKLGYYDSILEVGVGEATTLINVLLKLLNIPSNIFGFDISYSRIRYAMKYVKKYNINNIDLFVGDLFNAAFLDNSIDIVYSSHSLEPNRGRENEALMELYRITKKYLVLFEPAYEFANEKLKNYMDYHGYVRNIWKSAEELGYKVVEHKLIFKDNPKTLNNTAVTVIEKNKILRNETKSFLACPISKRPLNITRGNYYCSDSLLLYPIIDNIPCLLPENAVIATHYMDEISL